MKAIITCVNYDDYLAVTLPLNINLFEEVYVVTTPQDFATQKVCKDNKVKVVITDKFNEDGAIFNKGKAINEALKLICSSGWVCHLDADIVLSDFVIDTKELDVNTIYGCPRLMCPSMDAWGKYLNTKSTKRWGKFKPSYFILDDEIYNQYLPLGYLQIFNLRNRDRPYYPENSDDASKSDLRFSLKWQEHVCLEQITAIHLPIVGEGQEGTNWGGRKSPRFE